jgi:hypothetical protein
MNTFDFPLKENIVGSPHSYPLSFAPKCFPDNITILEADLTTKYERFVVKLGSPMWIGEFCVFMKHEGTHNWARDAVALFNKYQLGWAWWPYTESTQPAKRIPHCLMLTDLNSPSRLCLARAQHYKAPYMRLSERRIPDTTIRGSGRAKSCRSDSR